MSGRKKWKRKNGYSSDISGPKGISRPLPCPIYAQPKLGFAVAPELKERLLTAIDATLTSGAMDGSGMKAGNLLVQMERLNIEVEKLDRGFGDDTIITVEVIESERPIEDKACDGPSTTETTMIGSTGSDGAPPVIDLP